MKNNTKQIGLLIILLAPVIHFTASFGQCKGHTWPENRAKAEECVAVFGDAVKQHSYPVAVPAIRWMLTNAPNWNTKLYVDAATVYDELATQEKKPARKKELVDSLMLIFDMRIKFCGDEFNVLNRKAIAKAKHQINEKEKAPELLALFDRIYGYSNINDITDSNLDAYMLVIYANYINQKSLPESQRTLTEDQILARYDKIASVLDTKTKKAVEENKKADIDKYHSIKSSVDDKLAKMVTINCDFIKKNIEPRFKQKPNDIELAQKLFRYMLDAKCTDDPIWLEATEVVHKNKPDYALAKVLGAKYLQLKNYDKAVPALNQALLLAKTNTDKADINILLGDNEYQQGNKSTARNYYRKALTIDPANKDGYDKIGDLYFFSFNECSKKSSIAEDRLVYIAAYDMYARSGNQEKMKASRNQFPSVTELFELNWKEGESKKINCWIGESVTLRTRGKG